MARSIVKSAMSFGVPPIAILIVLALPWAKLFTQINYQHVSYLNNITLSVMTGNFLHLTLRLWNPELPRGQFYHANEFFAGAAQVSAHLREHLLYVSSHDLNFHRAMDFNSAAGFACTSWKTCAPQYQFQLLHTCVCINNSSCTQFGCICYPAARPRFIQA